MLWSFQCLCVCVCVCVCVWCVFGEYFFELSRFSKNIETYSQYLMFLRTLVSVNFRF